jgi:hypothetical protein
MRREWLLAVSYWRLAFSHPSSLGVYSNFMRVNNPGQGRPHCLPPHAFRLFKVGFEAQPPTLPPHAYLSRTGENQKPPKRG